MDESLSNLDAKLRVQMRGEIARVQKRIGVATIYVTHDQTEAMTLGDRVAVLRSGVLQQCDTPQALYDRPTNIFVAGFIGSPAMNLFEGALSTDLGFLTLGTQCIGLPSAVRFGRPGLKHYGGRRVVVGIRPEDLPVAKNESPEDAIDAEVEMVEALGSELLVHFRIDAPAVRAEGPENTVASNERVVSDYIARVDPRCPARAGERVRLSVSQDRIEFFDLGTGQAIWE
jgi:multiple sugar transport system ATP-binding protein